MEHLVYLPGASYHVPAYEEKVTDKETSLSVIAIATVSNQATHDKNISFH